MPEKRERKKWVGFWRKRVKDEQASMAASVQGL